MNTNNCQSINNKVYVVFILTVKNTSIFSYCENITNANRKKMDNEFSECRRYIPRLCSLFYVPRNIQRNIFPYYGAKIINCYDDWTCLASIPVMTRPLKPPFSLRPSSCIRVTQFRLFTRWRPALGTTRVSPWAPTHQNTPVRSGTPN